MSAASTNVGNLSSTLTLHVEADPSEMDKLIDAMEQGQRKLEQKANERASSAAFLPEVLRPEHRMADIRAERQLERDAIAMRVHGIDLVAAQEKTRHEKRMRQLLDEADAAEAAVFGGGAAIRGGRGMSAAERRNADAQSAGRSARIGGVFQETGRGIEDFLVSFSMAKTNAEGIAMGLRGSANNMAQLASYAGPLVGGLVAIGASLATIIVPKIIQWAYETKELTKEQEELLKKYLKTQTALAAISGGADAEKRLERVADEQGTQVRLVARLKRKLDEEMAAGTDFNDPKLVKIREALVEAGNAAEDALQERKLIQEEHRGALAEKLRKDRDKKDLEAATKRNKLLNDADEDRAKQKEADEKAMSKKIEDQIKSDFDLRVANQESVVDKLQEQVSKAGNANGPSAGLIRGTSAAESAINRAIAGSASQENTLKASLKVQQDQLKELRKQKQAAVASI